MANREDTEILYRVLVNGDDLGKLRKSINDTTTTAIDSNQKTSTSVAEFAGKQTRAYRTLTEAIAHEQARSGAQFDKAGKEIVGFSKKVPVKDMREATARILDMRSAIMKENEAFLGGATTKRTYAEQIKEISAMEKSGLSTKKSLAMQQRILDGAYNDGIVAKEKYGKESARIDKQLLAESVRQTQQNTLLRSRQTDRLGPVIGGTTAGDMKIASERFKDFYQQVRSGALSTAEAKKQYAELTKLSSDAKLAKEAQAIARGWQAVGANMERPHLQLKAMRDAQALNTRAFKADLIDKQEYLLRQDRINGAQEEFIRGQKISAVAAKQGLGIITDQVKGTENTIESLKRQQKEIVDGARARGKALEGDSARYASLGKQIKELDVSAVNQKNAESWAQINSLLGNSETRHMGLRAAIAQTNKEMKQNPAFITEGTRRIAEYNKELKNMDGGILGNIITMAKWMLMWSSMHAVINLVRTAIFNTLSITLEYDKAITMLAAITGETRTEIYRLSGDIFRLAEAYGFTIKEVTNGMTEWARTGKNMTEVIELMNTSLVMSNVSGMSIVDSTKSLIAVMQEYELTAQGVIEVVNKWVGLDVNHAITINDLAEGYKNVGSVAKEFGVGIDELNSMLVTIGETTQIAGSRVSNGVKMMFSRIYQPRTIEELFTLSGVIATTVDGVKPIMEILDEIGTKWGKFSEDTKIGIARTLGGTRQVNLIMALMDKWNDYTNTLTESQNSMNNAMDRSKTITEGYAKRWETLKTRTSELAISFGNRLVPALLAVGELFADMAVGSQEGKEHVAEQWKKIAEESSKKTKIVVANEAKEINVFGKKIAVLKSYQGLLDDIKNQTPQTGSTLGTAMDLASGPPGYMQNVLKNYTESQRKASEKLSDDNSSWITLAIAVKKAQTAYRLINAEYEINTKNITNHGEMIKILTASLDTEVDALNKANISWETNRNLIDAATKAQEENNLRMKDASDKAQFTVGVVRKMALAQGGKNELLNSLIRDLDKTTDKTERLMLSLDMVSELMASSKAGDEQTAASVQMVATKLKESLSAIIELEANEKKFSTDIDTAVRSQREALLEIANTVRGPVRDAFIETLKEIKDNAFNLSEGFGSIAKKIAELANNALYNRIADSMLGGITTMIAGAEAALRSPSVSKLQVVTAGINGETATGVNTQVQNSKAVNNINAIGTFGILTYLTQERNTAVKLARDAQQERANITFAQEGASIGAALGSYFPGFGTIVGTVAGGLIGSIMGQEVETGFKKNTEETKEVLTDIANTLQVSLKELVVVNRNLVAMREEVPAYGMRESYYFRPYVRDQNYKGEEMNTNSGSSVSMNGNIIINVPNGDPKAIVKAIEDEFETRKSMAYQG